MNKKKPDRAATQKSGIKESYPDFSTVTSECQRESWYKCEPSKRCRMILEVLNEPMTSRQVAYKLGFMDLNAVKPRISEMLRDGRVEVCGKAYDETTQRHVSVYRRKINDEM